MIIDTFSLKKELESLSLNLKEYRAEFDITADFHDWLIGLIDAEIVSKLEQQAKEKEHLKNKDTNVVSIGIASNKTDVKEVFDEFWQKHVLPLN